jgi:RNA polymerase sigma factor (sigma-70 family)
MEQLCFDLRNRQKATNEQIKSLEPMVHKFVNGMYKKMAISDHSLERDDLVQTAWMYVVEAINQYDETRGAKLSTFVFLKLMTKFSNITRKLVTHSKKNTVPQSHTGVGVAIDGFSDAEIEAQVPTVLLDHLVAVTEQTEHIRNIRDFLTKLTPRERRLVHDCFLQEKSPRTLANGERRKARGIKQEISVIRMKAQDCFA